MCLGRVGICLCQLRLNSFTLHYLYMYVHVHKLEARGTIIFSYSIYDIIISLAD